MIKKVYHIAALLALLNLAVVGAGIGYLVGTGVLGAEQVEEIAAVLRNELPEPASVEAEEVEQVPAPTRSSESIDQEQIADEMLRLQADRRKAELQQQAAMVSAARLEVTRQREALERRYDDLRAQAKQREEEEESIGFKKELELFSAMKPKVAVSYLLEKPREDAAALMLQMEARKAKRLIEAAKLPSQRRAMAEILQMLREMSPEQADALALASK